MFRLLMLRRPPGPTPGRSSAAAYVYKRQGAVVLFQRGFRVYPLLLKQAGKMIEKPGLRVIPIFVQADTKGVAQAIQ